VEIRNRLLLERAERSKAKEAQSTGPGTALLVMTSDKLTAIKKEAITAEFKRLYPKTCSVRSKAMHDGTARERGREVGRAVGLGLPVGRTGNNALGHS